MIPSNHSMVQRHAAPAQASGKPCRVNAVGLGDESGDFAEMMGGLLAAGATDLTPTAVLTALVQQADPDNTTAAPETALAQQAVADNSTAMADTLLAQQTPTGQCSLVAELPQTPGLALLPAICAPVVASAPVGYRTNPTADARNSPAEVVSAANGAGLALDQPAPQSLGESEASASKGMVRAPAMSFATKKDDGPKHIVAAVLSQPGPPGVAALPALLPVPGLAQMPDNKDRSKTSLVGAGLGLTGPELVSDRLGMSATYEVTQAAAVVAAPQIAESVSYWAAQGIQNAELTVEGLGLEPVQVHIVLDGDQVQVDFLSDQPQVRQVIEAATAQLKGLLLTQGMELSAVSVGSYGPGAHPSAARPPRPTGTRVTGVQMVQDEVAVSLRRLDATVGRALDLYV